MSEAVSTLPSLLAEHVATHPDREALVFGRRCWSYKDWSDAALAFAGHMAARGIGRGSTVGILMTTRPEWVVAMMASHWLGAEVVAFNTWAGDWDLDHLLEQSGVELLVTVGEFRGRDYMDTLERLIPEMVDGRPGDWSCPRYPRLREVVVVGANHSRGARAWDECIVHPPIDTAPSASPDAVALVLYTSGSTARPKGVQLVHRELVANGEAIGSRMKVDSSDRIWVSVPFFWSYGSANALMVALTHGATLVLQEAFDAVEAVSTIELERATAGYFLPHMTRAMTEIPGFRRSSFRTVSKGLTIGIPSDVRLLHDTLGVSGICNVYGSTETYGNCCVTPAEAPIEHRTGSQGPPLPGMSIAIVDPETGEELPPGGTGEIVVSGRITPGYRGDPDLSAETFINGRYKTGDLGRFDDKGWLVFEGRISEMIKTGGINVSPTEVEEFLSSHPAIVEVAVAGLPDEEKGEVVAAAIVREGDLTEYEVREWCRGRIAQFKVPSTIVFIDELPTTATGKLSRKGLLATLMESRTVPAGKETE